ncbi:MAG TPA: hypothetical protein PKJ98_04685 [Verrucomicrobiota bacterium]|nr:hypothetical protein [Verrucomicrobiota bacterium]
MNSARQINPASAYRKAGYSIAAYLCSGDVHAAPWRRVVALAGSEAARRARLGPRRQSSCPVRKRVPRCLRIAAQGLVVDNWASIDALARTMLDRPDEYPPAIVAEFLVTRFRPAS